MRSTKDRYIVCKSKDYAKFFHIKDNRPLNEPHVKKLMAEMGRKGYYHSCPVVVNDRDRETGKFYQGQFRVVDGQHKLEAARRLGIHFYYIIDNNVEPKEIITINRIRLGWTPQNYLDHHINRGRKEYIVLQKFVKDYGFRITPSVEMLSGGNSGGNVSTQFKEGNFKVASMKVAIKAALNIRSFQLKYKEHSNMYFIRAMIRLAGNKDYNHDRMMEKLRKKWMNLREWDSVKDYMEALGQIYNGKCQPANHVKFK